MRKKYYLTIVPRDQYYLYINTDGIPLRVVMDDGFDLSPDISFVQSKLDSGKNYIKNNSGKNDSFKITVMLSNKDRVPIYYDDNMLLEEYTEYNERVIDVLDRIIREGQPVYISTRAVQVPGGLWLITDNNSRKQYYDDGWVEWQLTFTKYYKIKTVAFKETTAGVNKAIAKYKSKKAKNNTSKAKSKTSTKQKLKTKCKYTQLVYSKNQKTVTCVKYMQKILNAKVGSKLTIDGWYGKETAKSVKKFQKKYAQKYSLSQTGKVDKNTFKALYSV